MAEVFFALEDLGGKAYLFRALLTPVPNLPQVLDWAKCFTARGDQPPLTGKVPPVSNRRITEDDSSLVICADLVACRRFDKELSIDTPGLGTQKAKLSICLPKDQSSKVNRKPLILVLEGGGFVLGEPKDGKKNDQKLSDEIGAIVVSVDYAKSPRHEYPHALLQIYIVLKWALSIEAELQGLWIDPAQVAIMGNSAGGNLTAALTLLLSFTSGPCAKFRTALGPRFRQVLQVLLYPSTELHHPYSTRFERSSPEVKEKSLPVWVAGMMEACYLPPCVDKNQIFIAPLLAEVPLLKELEIPPAIILTAGLDCLKEEAVSYSRKLKEAGHAALLTEYPLAIHGFTHYQPGNKEYREDDVIGSWNEIIEALKAAFKGK
ncbi:hypothetical protein G7Y89_g11386 [Cudoniella acicularis]|uniref:Alpha/beta hydrolase fold-3 domain-containing protein n=1 Tax=Cudoniella acicularis TaxID=354080 RepID=A0A8H4RDC1_9HELO|nr:hypothetical protein G7Y89_g11386 [Cudoniella acicularis]